MVVLLCNDRIRLTVLPAFLCTMKKNDIFEDTKKKSDASVYRKKSKTLLIASIVLACAVVFFLAFLFAYGKIKNYLYTSSSAFSLTEKWKAYDYEAVYEISSHMLERKPFSNTALTYHGYSSFYLAVSQTDTSLSQGYLDEAVNCMRLALFSAKKSLVPQLQYMLGKAYFYKNTVTSFYYADLALKYLSLAKDNGYKANDIPEYMGLSYAALGKPMESISSFTEALLLRESDSLLISIAEQYYKVGQTSAAKQYLYRIKKESSDELLVLRAMGLLGAIYTDEKNFSDAKAEFEEILRKNKNSADAYYGLGVLYEKQGDMVKARSEWRKALKLQVNHSGALSKLSEYAK